MFGWLRKEWKEETNLSQHEEIALITDQEIDRVFNHHQNAKVTNDLINLLKNQVNKNGHSPDGLEKNHDFIIKLAIELLRQSSLFLQDIAQQQLKTGFAYFFQWTLQEHNELNEEILKSYLLNRLIMNMERLAMILDNECAETTVKQQKKQVMYLSSVYDSLEASWRMLGFKRKIGKMQERIADVSPAIRHYFEHQYRLQIEESTK